MSDLHKRIGQRVRAFREKRNISQEELADICGLHRTYVGSVERGERNLTVTSLQTLAKGLRVTMAEIVKGLD
jgi:transcriptional regulator with XRE-family HTH domain